MIEPRPYRDLTSRALAIHLGRLGVPRPSIREIVGMFEAVARETYDDGYELGVKDALFKCLPPAEATVEQAARVWDRAHRYSAEWDDVLAARRAGP